MSKKSKNNKQPQDATSLPLTEEHILTEPTLGSWLRDFFVGIYQWVNPLKIISVMFFLYAFYSVKQHPNAMNLFFDKRFLDAGMSVGFTLFCLLLGIGLWRQRNWARLTSAIFLSIVFVFFAVMGIVSFHSLQIMFHEISKASQGGANFIFSMMVLPLFIYLSIVFYLLRKKTKAQCITLKELREEKALKKKLKQERKSLEKMHHLQKLEERKNFVAETLDD
jgi:FtsH-binding integral membrane protein